ncbi:expressed unknown protein [Ectocarpus siliculosus]|uniref:Uncharacterized protein n=1 Tax=Ectocarpus siliculosus TaxID=2880 RepID=D8LBR9_ECTSI|nr:expressed unknown protein [Ectocarpus siliculosus]|eukprot:CBN76778.1 expressed unknown protein [Ectocarpus siliculosus]
MKALQQRKGGEPQGQKSRESPSTEPNLDNTSAPAPRAQNGKQARAPSGSTAHRGARKVVFLRRVA